MNRVGGTGRHRWTRRRLFIVDEHPIVRHGLCRLIHQQKDLEVCGEVADPRAARRLIPAADPDAVIVHLPLRRRAELRLIKYLRQRCARIPILVFSDEADRWYTERVHHAGASGCLWKHAAVGMVLTMLRAALETELAPPTERDQPPDPLDKLSPRQRQVFHLIGSGLRTREVARRLGLAPSTVETHCQSIKRKLTLESGLALVQSATRWTSADAENESHHEPGSLRVRKAP